MSISTMRGDGGETSLAGGVRVSKASARVEASGTIDELNASMGFEICCGGSDARSNATPGSAARSANRPAGPATASHAHGEGRQAIPDDFETVAQQPLPDIA